MVQRASLFGHDYGLVLWNGVERCLINLKVSNDQFGWRVPEPFRECEILPKLSCSKFPAALRIRHIRDEYNS